MKKYKVEVLMGCLGLIVIHIVFFFDAFRGEVLNPEKASEFGNFIGGYVGTIFVLISVILLYATLKDQRNNSKIEKFENRFFLLTSWHKKNVDEIIIEDESGQKVFVWFIREFRAVYKIVDRIFRDSVKTQNKINVAYLCFFYGTGPNSRRIIKSELKDYDEFKIDQLINELSEDRKNTYENGKAREFKYYGGYQSRLSHYNRHLFQIVTYVDNQNIPINKKDYIKILRGQLSNHEQALFAINSLSSIGKEWNNKNLINEYELIKNIPSGFFDKKNEFDLQSFFTN